MSFAPGQRWISETEPELGLGTILEVNERQVRIVFPGSEDLRCYAADSAPIRRVAFQAGDTVLARDGAKILVESLEMDRGCIIYHGEGQRLPECDLSDAISFDNPDQRLRRGRVDSTHLFDLRAEALRHQYERRKSRVRGFVGGRVDLIKHQFYIAHNVANRYAPRVLLADEVGLGKTIEAGLILHRLLLSGRASRVLILVPESLVHQWFVEMYRRFNLWFNIFDEERCQAIAENNPDANPFLDDQLVLANIGFLSERPDRLKQALNAGWDLLCVDEAHHLGWSPEEVSPEYEVVDALGRDTPALLLLTATPEQLGQASHFARLRLLDPDRYFDLYTFLGEASDYRVVAEIADKLLRGDALDANDETELMNIFAGQEHEIRARLPAVARDPDARRLLLDDLLDQHGTGRVMYRNTRSAITGFPKRKLHRVMLDGSETRAVIAKELARETGGGRLSYNYESDPRIVWLEGLLRKLPGEKLLLICRAKAKALAIEEALRARINVKASVFHEGLTLLQRDRNAAWFGERDGAQLLICSEIGSEGRNFQFAHHLVLFDLPLNPELLEQRIGRLDRIGQTTDINIHLPIVVGSSEEVLGAWLHDGLDAIEHNLHGSFAAQERFGAQVEHLAAGFHEDPNDDALASLVEESREFRIALLDKLEHGRDRLLELNSYRPPIAKSLVAEIADLDAQEDLDNFMLGLWDHYGFTVEDLSNRSYLLSAEHTFTDALPSIPRDGLMLTFERRRALSREDIAFLSWDHPVVTGALDLMLSGEHGNASFAIWPAEENKGLLLEAIFLIDCVAPAHLHIDRFLPPTPLRLIINHHLAVFADELPPTLVNTPPTSSFLEKPQISQVLLPKMIEHVRELADEQTPAIVAAAEAAMHAVLDHEADRLRLLQQVNDHVRDDEIRIAEEQAAALHGHIAKARPRLDAVRLIWHGNPAAVLG